MSSPGIARFDAPFGEVRFPISLIEDLSEQAAAGYRRTPWGGVEIGGLLVGSRDKFGVLVAEIMPVVCEHEFGPSFELTDKDRAGMEAEMGAVGPDREVLGWFRTTSRELALTPSDLVLANSYFSDPASVTLVIQRGKDKEPLFALFLRNSEGRGSGFTQAAEFTAKSLLSPKDMPPASPGPARQPAAQPAPAESPEPATSAAGSGQKKSGEQPRRRSWRALFSGKTESEANGSLAPAVGEASPAAAMASTSAPDPSDAVPDIQEIEAVRPEAQQRHTRAGNSDETDDRVAAARTLSALAAAAGQSVLGAGATIALETYRSPSVSNQSSAHGRPEKATGAASPRDDRRTPNFGSDRPERVLPPAPTRRSQSEPPAAPAGSSWVKNLGFRCDPFEPRPDLEFFVETPSHREALAVLEYGVSARKGVLVLTGPDGCGKTLVLAALAERLRARKIEFRNVPAGATVDSLYEIVADGFGFDLSKPDKAAVLLGLNGRTAFRAPASSALTLLVDDADAHSAEMLREIEELDAVENRSGKLIEVVLVGRPELDALLDHPYLRGLRQRVVMRAQLKPLTVAETPGYIASRMKAADADPARFSPDAAQAVHVRSAGIPSRINQMCRFALDRAAETGQPVTVELIQSIAPNTTPGENEA